MRENDHISNLEHGRPAHHIWVGRPSHLWWAGIPLLPRPASGKVVAAVQVVNYLIFRHFSQLSGGNGLSIIQEELSQLLVTTMERAGEPSITPLVAASVSDSSHPCPDPCRSFLSLQALVQTRLSTRTSSFRYNTDYLSGNKPAWHLVCPPHAREPPFSAVPHC